MKKLIALLLLPIALYATDEEQIRDLLNKWPVHFNAKHEKEVCSLFSKKLVASYPGTLDRNFEAMCNQLKNAMKSDMFRYEEPKIEQVIVQGDFAVVRLVWRLLSASNTGISFVEEKGLDVFERQPDGSWKILISYAYPIEQ